jgi:predicted patatin/cPLA2 family phospholipase
MQSRKACADITLEDHDWEGKKIFKEKIDFEKIWEALGEICVPDIVISELNRYCHQPNTKRVLALAGGGAKGLVGNYCVVYLLDQLNLMQYFDEIWGVSAGSIIGAAYCSHIKPIELLEFLTTVKNRDFFQFTLEGALKGDGFLKSAKIHDFIEKMLHCEKMEACPKPFYALAVEFDETQEKIKVFDSGSLADAVVASMSVPDIFEPIEINGKYYVDGGLIENTPSVSILKRYKDQHDSRNLAIFGTCFGEEHFHPSHRTLLKKATNLLGVYRYQLQLEQVERVRATQNCEMTMINLDIEINRMEFSRMGFAVIPTYLQLLKKLEFIAKTQNFNQTV